MLLNTKRGSCQGEDKFPKPGHQLKNFFQGQDKDTFEIVSNIWSMIIHV